MAINITYEKSALQQFAEEIPDLILQYQQMEAQKEQVKEQRQYEQDVRDKDFERQLMLTHGADNVIIDTSGSPRPKTSKEGYDYKLTPDYASKEALIELESRKQKENTALQLLLEDYTEHRDELSKAKGDLQRNITNLPDEVVTGLAVNITDDIYKGIESGSYDALVSATDRYKDALNTINRIESDYNNQKTYYAANKMNYVGKNQMLDASEFKELINDYQALNPNALTIGLEGAYSKDATRDPIARQAHVAKLINERSAKGKSAYITMQSQLQDTNKNITKDSLEEFFKKNEIIDPIMQGHITQALQYPSDNWPKLFEQMALGGDGEKVRETLSKTFTVQMGILEDNYNEIATINSETFGGELKNKGQSLLDGMDSFLLNLGKEKGSLDNPSEDVAKALLQWKKLSGQTSNKDEIKNLFGKIENHFGFKGDTELYDMYQVIQGSPTQGDFSKMSPRTRALMAEYGDAESIFNALDALGKDHYGKVQDMTWNLSSPEAPIEKSLGIRSVDRMDWSLGKALFSGGGKLGLGWDSPYYDAYYQHLQDYLETKTAEETPFGPDFMYTMLTDEHTVPNIIANYYPEEYAQVVKQAESLGKEAQIEQIRETLKETDGDNYYDLMNTLDFIKYLPPTMNKKMTSPETVPEKETSLIQDIIGAGVRSTTDMIPIEDGTVAGINNVQYDPVEQALYSEDGELIQEINPEEVDFFMDSARKIPEEGDTNILTIIQSLNQL